MFSKERWWEREAAAVAPQPSPGRRECAALHHKSRGSLVCSAACASTCSYPKGFQDRLCLFMLKLSEKLEIWYIGGFFFSFKINTRVIHPIIHQGEKFSIGTAWKWAASRDACSALPFPSALGLTPPLPATGLGRIRIFSWFSHDFIISGGATFTSDNFPQE